MDFKIFWGEFFKKADFLLDYIPVRELLKTKNLYLPEKMENLLIHIQDCCDLSSDEEVFHFINIVKDYNYYLTITTRSEKFLCMYACNRLLRRIYGKKNFKEIYDNIKLIIEPDKCLPMRPNTIDDITNHLWMYLFSSFTDNDELSKKLHSYLLKEYQNKKKRRDKKVKNISINYPTETIPEKVLIQQQPEFNEEFFEKNLLFLNQIVGIRNDVLNPPKKPYIRRKRTIPKALKTSVWIKYAGSLDVGVMKCVCCKMRDIYQSDFHCGHIVAEANGGPTVMENLRPVCSVCNLSMGTMNMDQFIKVNGF